MSIITGSYGQLNQNHLDRIKNTLNKALQEYPRTMVVRADLFLPDNTYNHDAAIITRCIASLKAQVTADILRRQLAGKRVHPCRIRYVWAREFCQNGIKHYHLALFFNKDTYVYPGTYRSQKDGTWIHNLSVMIMEAWVRALNLHTQDNYQLYYAYVNFPGRGYIHLNSARECYAQDHRDALSWLSYLAKEYSKDNSDGQRNFGCSQY